MPQLKWDETDFIDCLEVLPEVEEYATSHYFEVRQDSLILQMTIWQYESVVAISLSQDGFKDAAITIWLYVLGGVHYTKDKRGEYLTFQNTAVVPCRSFYDEEDFSPQANLDVKLSIKPQIRIIFE